MRRAYKNVHGRKEVLKLIKIVNWAVVSNIRLGDALFLLHRSDEVKISVVSPSGVGLDRFVKFFNSFASFITAQKSNLQRRGSGLGFISNPTVVDAAGDLYDSFGSDSNRLLKKVSDFSSL